MHSVGNTSTAAQGMATRLRNDRFFDSEMSVLGEGPRSGNFVVRLRGTGASSRHSISPTRMVPKQGGKIGPSIHANSFTPDCRSSGKDSTAPPSESLDGYDGQGLTLAQTALLPCPHRPDDEVLKRVG
jgi:hypothetical protein